MLWIKSFHIIFMVTWFAGLFYLPRLFVYHAMTEDQEGCERFKIMERKLFYGIMTPGGVLTLVFGIWLMWGYGFSGVWLTIKIVLVLLLVAYHVYCGKLVNDFKYDRNPHSHKFYRVLNEFPVLVLVAIILLVELKPWS
ncbi:MAG: CopD family protein [Gammaproteobacteria bacterium]|nr:MAG: CopD family protein [Gammaproteobacteria bacterium]